MARKKGEAASRRLFRDSSGQSELFEKSLEEELDEKEARRVECLGITFESEEARREYFLARLREELRDPEFRKTPGFPKGSDEDILRMSDPPWYTACPNPFLGEVAERRTNRQSDDSYRREPYPLDVREGKNDPILAAHPYHTKVPPAALLRLLLHYTSAGDVVLDPFCGSGMLGVAAGLCSEPEKYIRSASGESGARTAILSDISPAATFIGSVTTRSRISASAFATEAASLVAKARDELGWMYKTKYTRDSGRPRGAEILYSIWTEFYLCPNCQSEFRAWDIVVDRDDKKIRKEFPCPACQASLKKASLARPTEMYFDSLLGQPAKRTKRAIALIHFSAHGRRFEKTPDPADLSLLEAVGSSKIPPSLRTEKMMFNDPPWGDFHRSGYHDGITHVHHFFTMRNYLALWRLRELALASAYPREMLFVLTSILDNHTSIRNRYIVDKHHPRGTTCGPLPNSLYVPELWCEVNPFRAWEKAAKKQQRIFEISRPATSYISTEASRLGNLPRGCVDYIFADPPFGKNILYRESAFLWEHFIGVYTHPEEEAIISGFQNKDLSEYKRLIQEVLEQCYRVLKPRRWITLEFSNRSNAVWNAISDALWASGFVIADVRVLDKRHGTIRQDLGQSVKQDLIISCYRPSEELPGKGGVTTVSNESTWSFVREHLGNLPVFLEESGVAVVIAERTPHVLFDRMVAFHVQRGLSVPLGSGDFQKGLVQRFPCRDGMYFLPNQATDYDERRISVKELRQLDLYPTDEASAIQWLRQRLQTKPQRQQDLTPLFHKEIHSWAKHEIPMDIRDLLDQNFLCYHGRKSIPLQIVSYLKLSSIWRPKIQRIEVRGGISETGLETDDEKLIGAAKDRWYVPNPKRQGDLEKSREQQLLREFDEYKRSGQGRLREFRTEAIRVGFRAAYNARDYQSIVDLGRRLPASMLQQDDKLTMYFDVARLRSGED